MPVISWAFAGLVLASLVVYYLLPQRPQNYWLLAVSYVFAVAWDWQFAVVLLAATAANFALAHRLQKGAAGQQAILWVGISLNVAALLFFKNANFFLPPLLGRVAGLGVPTQAGGLQILIPLGLSYYTLQAISYLIDVSRGQLAAATDFVDFALYMAYFPKLVAGPIERARTFIPLLAQPRMVDNEVLGRSFTLIVVGLFRKLVLADPLSGLINASAFQDPKQFSSPQLWLYLLAYAFALYNDFAGYTSIVRGVSGLFGLELSPNFLAPYFARSFAEFWNRWHISLSHWLRDYVYLPLSRWLLKHFSNRRHLAHLVVPPVLTMLVSALWHATWDHKTILLWGLLHGLYQVVERFPTWLGRPVTPLDSLPRWQQALRALIIFLAVCLAWLFFREGSQVGLVLNYWVGLFDVRQFHGPIDFRILLGIGLAVLIDWAQAYKQDEALFRQWPLPVRSAMLAFALLAIFFVSQTITPAPFVYQGF